MSSVRGMLERFQRRATRAVDGAPAVASDVVGKKDVHGLVNALKTLPPVKQTSVCEVWPGAELKLADGVVVTVRSTKERRRFIRPGDLEVLEWLRAFEAGDVFYDIGANCGSLTLAAAGMHRERVRIVAIEPGFANFESLARNLSQNGMLEFVTPLQIGLLDRTGLEQINYYRSTAAGTSLHAVGRPVNHEGHEFTPVATQMVLGYTLDDLIDVMGLPRPTRVKIDVDGAEGALLDGATRTLARGSVREFLIEVVDHDRAGTRLSLIRSHLERHGYALAKTFSHHADDPESFVADHLFRRGTDHRGMQAEPLNEDSTEPTAARKRDERLAQRTEVKLVREREASAAKLARQGAQVNELRTKVAEARTTVAELRSMLTERRSELAELRSSYYLSGADKKLDIREIYGFSEIVKEIVAAGRTGMSYDRLFTLWQAVRGAPPDMPAIEIGSYMGGSARFISQVLQASGTTPRFYVCDTFAGHAQTDSEVDTTHHGAGKFEDVSLEATKTYLSGYPALEIVVGDIVQTSSRFADESFGFVHLDVDVYPTTEFCLRFFAPRLAEGGLMVIDDYATTTCPGVKQAADEFVAQSPRFRLWHLLTGQALLSRVA